MPQISGQINGRQDHCPYQIPFQDVGQGLAAHQNFQASRITQSSTYGEHNRNLFSSLSGTHQVARPTSGNLAIPDHKK